MKKTNNWINTLFALIFIAIPSLIIFYFLLPTWSNKLVISYWKMWIVAIGFCFYSFAISFGFVYFKILSIDSLNFNIPITLSLMTIFVSYNLPTWAIFLIVVLVIITSFPINIWTQNYKKKKIKKIKKNN
jgi:hypothetical protein